MSQFLNLRLSSDFSVVQRIKKPSISTTADMSQSLNKHEMWVKIKMSETRLGSDSASQCSNHNRI